MDEGYLVKLGVAGCEAQRVFEEKVKFFVLSFVSTEVQHGLYFAESQCGVVSTKAKGVAESKVDTAVCGFVEGEVEGCDVWVVGEVVDCRRDDIVFNSQYGCNGLNSTGGTKEMAGHGFSGVEGDFVCLFAEEGDDGTRFGHIAHGG